MVLGVIFTCNIFYKKNKHLNLFWRILWLRLPIKTMRLGFALGKVTIKPTRGSVMYSGNQLLDITHAVTIQIFLKQANEAFLNYIAII